MIVIDGPVVAFESSSYIVDIQYYTGHFDGLAFSSLTADTVLCGQYVLCNIEPLLRDNLFRKLPLIQEINTVHLQ